MTGRAGVPREHWRFFWECRPEEIDVREHAPFILGRLLDHGDLAAARWVLATYGEPAVRDFILTRGCRTLSRKTIAFWRAYLHLEDEPCLQPSSLAASRPLWNA
jgi:hypothetical protein